MENKYLKIQIEKNGPKELPYNAKILRSTDTVNFYYCGEGKFFKTLEEAKEFQNKTLSN